MTIKGMKKIEIKGAEIRKKVVISLCLFRYGTFFEYKTIAKKTCAPKTGATLAMPNIFSRIFGNESKMSFVVKYFVTVI